MTRSPRPWRGWRSASIGVFAAALLVGVVGSVRAQETVGARESRRSDQIEEIVVRARKRAELIQDTPVSVTALSQTALRDAGITRLDDIQSLVPNLTLQATESQQGGLFYIRGVGTTASELAFDPGVGVYVDGVFLPRSLGSLMEIVDIQQIEVLRGPQGTLFGKNTVGGAVSLTTVKPHDEFEGHVFLRAGNFDTVSTRATLNVPLWEDKVAARLSFGQTSIGGYAKNRFLDQTWDDRESLAFLGTIRFQPTENFTFDVTGTWAREHGHGGGPQCRYVQAGPIGVLYPDLEERCNASRPFEFSADAAQISDVKSYGAWGVATWDIGEVGPVDLSLKYVGSWREQRGRIRMDNDGTALTLVQIANPGGGPRDGRPNFQRQIQQEFQVNVSALDGRYNGVTGYFLFFEDGRDNRVVTTAVDTINFIAENQVAISNWTWAIFHQSTLDVTDWMSVTGGIRYSEDKKGLVAANVDPFRPDLPPMTEPPRAAVFTAWTPMASLALHTPENWLDGTPIESLMTYFTYSRGFKGGGFNGVLNPADLTLNSFDPEFLDSYEIGFKTVAFDRALTMNVAAFRGDYDDIQVITLLDITEEDDPRPNLVQTTLNAAKATIQGIEVELFAVPAPGLRIRGSFGYLDTVYDDFLGISNLTSEPVQRAGQRFDTVPELQAQASIEQTIALDPDVFFGLDGTLTPRFAWSFRGNVQLTGPEIPQAIQSGYHLFDARLAYDFFDGQAQVAMYVRNISDERAIRYAVAGTVSTFGVATNYFIPPRTFGAELSYRF